MKTVTRINTTLPKTLIKAIDRARENRSRFLAEAAAEKLAREKAAVAILRSAGIVKPKRSGKTIVDRLRRAELKRLKALYR